MNQLDKWPKLSLAETAVLASSLREQTLLRGHALAVVSWAYVYYSIGWMPDDVKGS